MATIKKDESVSYEILGAVTKALDEFNINPVKGTEEKFVEFSAALSRSERDNCYSLHLQKYNLEINFENPDDLRRFLSDAVKEDPIRKRALNIKSCVRWLMDKE